jgi:hypothetical protein
LSTGTAVTFRLLFQNKPERDVLKLSSEKILDIVDNAKMLVLIPDNGRDPDMWKSSAELFNYKR